MMRAALKGCPSPGAVQRGTYPLDYSPFVPGTIKAQDYLRKAKKGWRGEQCCGDASWTAPACFDQVGC